MKKYSLFLLHLTCLSEGICTVKLTVMGKVHNNALKGHHAESKQKEEGLFKFLNCP